MKLHENLLNVYGVVPGGQTARQTDIKNQFRQLLFLNDAKEQRPRCLHWLLM
jgi:hypothetical protein